MKCNECQEALSAYYDKLLDKEQAAEVIAHLAECKSCREEYAKLKTILGFLKETNEDEIVVPSLLHKQMLAKVAKQAQKNKVKYLWPQRIGGMVAVLLVGVILVKINPLEIKNTHESELFLIQEATNETTDITPQGTLSTADASSNQINDEAEDIAQVRIIPHAEMTESTLISQESSEKIQVNQEENVIHDQNDSSLPNETGGPVQGKLDSRNRTISQVWEMQTDDIEALIAYLEGYVKNTGGTVEVLEETQISFILKDILDGKTLFDALQTQDFTKSLIAVEETGENIKITVKD